MKRTLIPSPALWLMAVSLLVAVFCRCSSNPEIDGPDNPPQPYLTIDSDILPIASCGGESTLHLSTNEPWSLTAVASEEAGDEWFRVSPMSGEAGEEIAVTVCVDENRTYTDRSFALNVQTSSQAKSLTVTQHKLNAIIAGANRYELDSDAQTLTVEIRSNVEYSVSVTAGGEWFSPAGDSLTDTGLTSREHSFEVAANPEPQERTATVVFQDLTSGLSDEITVVQAAWADPNPERTALCALYRDANGGCWTRSDNWCSDRPLDEWYGVVTDAEGHVTELRLPDNNLRGGLAHEIANLQHLRILDLSSNELDCDLIYELPLEYKEASKCDLDDLKELEEINLSHNRLKSADGATLKLTDMPSLRKVDLSYNQLNCWVSYPTWAPLFANGRAVDLIFNGNQMYGEVAECIMNHPEWDRLALQLVRQNYPNTISYAKDIHVPDFTFTDLRTGARESIRAVCGANELTMVLAWDPTDEGSCRFAERSVYRYHTLYGAQGFAVVAIIPEGEKYRQAAEQYLASHEVAWPVVADYADARGRRLVLPMEPYPSYLIFDREGVLKDDIHNGARAKDPIDDEPNTFDLVNREFQYANYMNEYCYDTFGDCTYESRDYSMDKQTELLQAATKGNGVNIVLIGDVFTDVDIETGFYRDAMEFAMESFFSVEPTKTYREYFNVYTVYAVSRKRQLGTYRDDSALWTVANKYGITGISTNYSKVNEYAAPIRWSSMIVPCVIINGDQNLGGRITIFESSTDTYAYVAFPYNGRDYMRTFLLHEFVGHGFGLLGDEYILREYQEELLSESTKNRIRLFQQNGSYLNISLTDDPKAVPWAHFIGHPRYPEVGIGAGGYSYAKGVWHALPTSLMGLGSGFGPVCRELIVRRILTLAGEEYTFEKFLEKDVASTPTMLNTRALQTSPEYRHCPPIYLNKR